MCIGVFAIVLPLLAAVVVELLIGSVLLVSGIVGLLSSFAMRRATCFAWSLSATAGMHCRHYPDFLAEQRRRVANYHL